MTLSNVLIFFFLIILVFLKSNVEYFPLDIKRDFFSGRGRIFVCVSQSAGYLLSHSSRRFAAPGGWLRLTQMPARIKGVGRVGAAQLKVLR